MKPQKNFEHLYQYQKKRTTFFKNAITSTVYNFTDFNYRKPIKREDGKVEWIESEDYYKHLKPRGNNQSGDIEGVVYEIYDKTKHNNSLYYL